MSALSLAKVLYPKCEVPSCLGSPWPGLHGPGSNRIGGEERGERGGDGTDNQAFPALL